MQAPEKKIKDILQELEAYLPQDQFLKEKQSISALPTGSLTLDEAIGIGGYPEGKIIEIFGTDSSGKTTLALHALVEAQKLNKTAVYIDLENTIHLSWAQKIGVDINRFYISRPKNGEAVFDLIRKLIESSVIDLIIVDSVSTLVPYCELDNTMEDQQMGLHARLMSKGLRVVQNAMINKKTTIIFINQVRERMSGMNTFVPSVTTTGGRALKYAAGVRIEVKKCERIQDSAGKVLGFATKCVVVKNKFGAPMGIAHTAIYFDSGFDQDYEIVHRLMENKVLVKKGAWLEKDGKNLAQGTTNLRNKLKIDRELREQLKKLAFPALADGK